MLLVPSIQGHPKGPCRMEDGLRASAVHRSEVSQLINALNGYTGEYLMLSIACNRSRCSTTNKIMSPVWW